MRRVLVIDDEQDFGFFLKQNLESAGDYQVTVCSDAKEGLRIARAMHPDVALIDIMMPQLTGEEIVIELKNDPNAQDIQVIFLTAMVQEQEAKDRNNLIGGEYFVAKPVRINELIATMEKALAQRKP